MNQQDLETGEEIFGIVPEYYFDSEVDDNYVLRENNGDETSRKSRRNVHESDDIFARLKKRIALAMKNPNEPDIIQIIDSDDEDSEEPIWRPGKHFKRFQKEMEIHRRSASPRLKLVPPTLTLTLPISNLGFVSSVGLRRNSTSNNIANETSQVPGNELPVCNLTTTSKMFVNKQMQMQENKSPEGYVASYTPTTYVNKHSQIQVNNSKKGYIMCHSLSTQIRKLSKVQVNKSTNGQIMSQILTSIVNTPADLQVNKLPVGNVNSQCLKDVEFIQRPTVQKTNCGIQMTKSTITKRVKNADNPKFPCVETSLPDTNFLSKSTFLNNTTTVVSFQITNRQSKSERSIFNNCLMSPC